MLFISVLVGLLDGLGLTMFIPLLESLSNDGTTTDLGALSVIPELLDKIGLHLSLVVTLFVMLFFFMLKGIAKFFQGYTTALYQQFFTRKIRNESIDGLAKYEFKAFIKSDAGHIQNSLSGEAQRLVVAYLKYSRMLQNMMLLLAYIVMALLVNFQFAALVVLGGIVTNFLFSKLYNWTKTYSSSLVISNNAFQGLLIQMVAFFKYLRATGSMKKYKKYLNDRVIEIEKTQFKIGLIDALVTGVREPMIILVIVVVILISVNSLGQPLGSIILSLVFFYRALTAVMSVQGEYNKFLALSGSLNNIKEFLTELNSNESNNSTKKFEGFQHKIEFSGLDFYFGDKKVLDKVSLSIKKNETVALVGESGSGKTTIINILSGLLRPQNGHVLVDGNDLFDFDLESYHKRIGYITQEPVIFDDTIFNNVTFWDDNLESNFNRCWEALEKANLLDFIEELPQKIDSRLGNNGINISGGQKQRISIARELYKNTDILIMDEATSALDSETEKVIQANIDALQGKYTIVIVAHRLSTIKNADRVILMKDGKILEIDSYENLLNSSTSFKKMVELQEV